MLSADLPIALDAMGGDNAPEEIVRGAALAARQLGVRIALVGKRALHGPALHRPVAVDHGEAARLLDEDLDDRLGAAEIEFAPPFLVGRDDRQRADLVRAHRDFLFAARLVLVARAGVGQCRRCGDDKRRGSEKRRLGHRKPPSI